MLKSVALHYNTTPVEYDFEKFKEKLPEDTFTDSVEISMSNSKFILEAVRQITIKGIIPGELEKAIFVPFRCYFLLAKLRWPTNK